jgi:hypothetical protein
MEREAASTDWEDLKIVHVDEEQASSVSSNAQTSLLRAPAQFRIVTQNLYNLLAQDAYAAVIEVQLVTDNSEPIIVTGNPVPLSIQPSPSWDLEWESALAQIVQNGDKLEMLCIVLLQKTFKPASAVRSGAILGYASLPAAQLYHRYTSNDPIQIRLKDRFHGDCDVFVELSIRCLEPDLNLFRRALHEDQVLADYSASSPLTRQINPRNEIQRLLHCRPKHAILLRRTTLWVCISSRRVAFHSITFLSAKLQQQNS